MLRGGGGVRRVKQSALNVNTLAGQIRSADSGLVHYELPYTAQMPTPLTAATALPSRPSSATGARPDLPSLVPSDEYTNSPVNAIYALEGPIAALGGQPQVSVIRPEHRRRKHLLASSTRVSSMLTTQSHTTSLQSIFIPNTPSQLPSTSNLAPAASRTNSLARKANAAPVLRAWIL
jgi:hypothetical protein